MEKKFVVYLGSFCGKSKESGKPFFMYKLAQVSEDVESGALTGRVKDFFAPRGIDVDELQFGDIVEPVWEQDDFGQNPRLIDLNIVSCSPYVTE